MTTKSRPSDLLHWVTPLAAFGGLFGALAYYFGSVFLTEQYALYGTPLASIGYGRSDIVLRSMNVFAINATPAIASAIVGLLIYQGTAHLTDRLVAIVGKVELLVALVGLASLSSVLLYGFRPGFRTVTEGTAARTWFILVGSALILWLLAARLLCVSTLWISKYRKPAADLATFIRIASSATFVAALFFTARSVAFEAGATAACENEVDQHRLGVSTVVSNVDLGLTASVLRLDEGDVEIVAIGNSPSNALLPYVRPNPTDSTWEYGGLRILTRAGDRYWVFPMGRGPRSGIIGLPTENLLVVSTRPTNLAVNIPVTKMCAELLGRPQSDLTP